MENHQNLVNRKLDTNMINPSTANKSMNISIQGQSVQNGKIKLYINNLQTYYHCKLVITMLLQIKPTWNDLAD